MPAFIQTQSYSGISRPGIHAKWVTFKLTNFQVQRKFSRVCECFFLQPVHVEDNIGGMHLLRLEPLIAPYVPSLLHFNSKMPH